MTGTSSALSLRVPADYKETLPQREIASRAEIVGPFIEVLLPLWEVLTEGVLVRPSKPVGIRLRREGDEFLAENDTLGIYSSGESAEEAVVEFHEVLSYFIEHYRSTPEAALVGQAIALKSTFRDLFPKP